MGVCACASVCVHAHVCARVHVCVHIVGIYCQESQPVKCALTLPACQAMNSEFSSAWGMQPPGESIRVFFWTLLWAWRDGPGGCPEVTKERTVLDVKNENCMVAGWVFKEKFQKTEDTQALREVLIIIHCIKGAEGNSRQRFWEEESYRPLHSAWHLPPGPWSWGPGAPSIQTCTHHADGMYA